MLLATCIGAWMLGRHLTATAPGIHTLHGLTMGSTWQVNVVAASDSDAEAMRTLIERELLRLDDELSGYRAETALSRLNAAPVGTWCDVPAHLRAVLRFGQRLHADSSGAFDLGVRPLVNVWGFGAAEPRTTLPGAAEIAAAKARLGSQALEFDAVGKRARRKRDTTFDVDAIAPGYVADHVSDLLLARGLPSHMVEIGGELRVRGRRPDGTHWRIGIERPALVRRDVARVIHVSDVGIATSGDYRDFVTIGGRRFSHTIDPASGWPVDHALASVTVIAPTALEADGLATVLMVLGPQRGLAFANARGLAVHMLVRDEHGGYAEQQTLAFAPYVKAQPVSVVP